MSENKGTYVFSAAVLNKRLEELKLMPVPFTLEAVEKLIELTTQITVIAQTALQAAPYQRSAYADEEVRELARHLNAVIKAYHNDNSQGLPAAQVRDAEGFLRSKKYFNLNQSDLIV